MTKGYTDGTRAEIPTIEATDGQEFRIGGKTFRIHSSTDAHSKTDLMIEIVEDRILKKMDYTVIGDNVNLGARFEGLTRKYNNHIIISEFTYAKVKDIVQVNELGAVTVKGRERPVVIYDLVGLRGA